MSALVSTSQATTVQITLLNNFIASTSEGGLSNFTQDFTGDGIDEIPMTIPNSSVFDASFVHIEVAEIGFARYFQQQSSYALFAGLVYPGGVPTSTFIGGPTSTLVSGLSLIEVTDVSINGGAPTQVWLDVTAQSLDQDSHFVIFNRLIFDNESTTAPQGISPTDGSFSEFIPEPSATLLGAAVLFCFLGRSRRR